MESPLNATSTTNTSPADYSNGILCVHTVITQVTLSPLPDTAGRLSRRRITSVAQIWELTFHGLPAIDRYIPTTAMALDSLCASAYYHRIWMIAPRYLGADGGGCMISRQHWRNGPHCNVTLGFFALC